MPPKPKFTKEEIVQAALRIVSSKGDEALTAQELKGELGTSASPIFTVFDSMGEIREEVRLAAMKRFENFAADDLSALPPFKQVGMKMVLFGKYEPKLYRLLFMSENEDVITFDGLLGKLGDSVRLCLDEVKNDYGLDECEARALFENVWVYTFGVGTLCATRMCDFSKERLGEMLTSQFEAVMMLIRAKRGN